MDNKRVLVVDDDKDLNEFTCTILQEEGFIPTGVYNGKSAISTAKELNPGIVLLDLNLPDLDGEDILKEIKGYSELIPVIVVSGKQSTAAKVLTLGIGADDYVTKPYDAEELIARVKSNIKKYNHFQSLGDISQGDNIVRGDITLDLRNFIIIANGREEKVSPRLFKLIRFFMENPDTVFSKKEIYKTVWESEDFDDNTVTVFIRKLRKIIEENSGKPKHLLTIWGEGYKFTF